MTTGTIPASCWACPPSRRRKSSQQQQQQHQQQQRPQAAETRWWFTEEELAKIQEQLDKLLPYSTCSSKTVSHFCSVRMFACRRMFSCLLSHLHVFLVLFVCAVQTARPPPTPQPALGRPRGPPSRSGGHPGDKAPGNCTNFQKSGLQTKPWWRCLLC